MKYINMIANELMRKLERVKKLRQEGLTKSEIQSMLYKLLLSWLIVSAFYIATSDISFVDFYFFQSIKLPIFIGCVLFIWVILCMIPSKKYISVLMIITALLYAILGVIKYSSFFFSAGCCVAVALLILHTNINGIDLKVHKSVPWIVASVLIIALTAFVGGICCLIYKNHWTSCYDFGLFAQMFHYMKNTGLPLITCERDGLLSHFAVHFSPIFYLLLPIYFVVPSPCTLLVMQAFVVVSGVIPIILICRNHKLSHCATTLFAVCYALYPCFTGSCFFYIHENNFLASLILWLIYFLERKKSILIFISAFLVLLVKEDAAVYVAVISLYFLCAQKNYKCSISLLIISIIYFLCVTHYLSVYGNGAMTWRYSNYMYDGSDSLVTMIIAVFKNPIYVVQQGFTQEKIIFIIQMLLPICFLPLITKNPSRYILMIPFLLVNLMTNYQYQYNIGFQYCFGSGSLLLYLAVVNYSELKDGRKLLLTSACCSVIVFFGLYYNKLNYIDEYKWTSEQRETIDYALSLIPDDASVISSTFILPNLSQRDEIYQLETTDQTAEYYVLDLRYTTDEYSVATYLTEEYELIFYKTDTIVIFRKI